MANGKTGRRTGLIERLTRFDDVLAEMEGIRKKLIDSFDTEDNLRKKVIDRQGENETLKAKNIALQNHNVQLNQEVDRLKDLMQDFVFGIWKPRQTLGAEIQRLNDGAEISDETFNAALETLLNRRRAVYETFGLTVIGDDQPFPNPCNDLQKAVNKLGLHAPDQDQLHGIYFSLWPRHLFGEPSRKFVDRKIRELLAELPRKQKAIRVLKRHEKLWHPKWKGYRIEDVMFHDPAYLVWMHEKGDINLDLNVYREAQNRSSYT